MSEMSSFNPNSAAFDLEFATRAMKPSMLGIAVPMAPNHGAPTADPSAPSGSPARPFTKARVAAAIATLAALLAVAPVGLIAASKLAGTVGASGTQNGQTQPNAPTPQGPVSPPTTGNERKDLVDMLRRSVVRIEATGEFLDDDGTSVAGVASGSGFVIGDNGTIVTNNHVVGAAASLKVFVGTETTARSARLVGVSECSDLAVITVDGQLPKLGWNTNGASAGTDVLAAGFPLGDPEFTVTKGIVSKSNAGGQSSWASVAHVLEHDATINGGSSGGPLVDESGAVVGINYAGDAQHDKSFAIAADTAQEIVKVLSTGRNLDSIGITARAVVDGETSSVLVESVRAGSAADDLGLQIGDNIVEMGGIPVGAGGDLSAYCDIVRSNGNTPVKFKVVRQSNNSVLEGQLNGRPLAETETAGADDTQSDETQGGDTQVDETTAEGASDMKSWEYFGLTVDAPAGWDASGNSWSPSDGVNGVSMNVSASLKEYDAGDDVLGVTVFGSHRITDTAAQFLKSLGTDCSDGTLKPFSNDTLEGHYAWKECAGRSLLYVVAREADGDTVGAVFQGFDDLPESEFGQLLESILGGLNLD